ncbi:hypothetical protein ACH4U5_06790 [Streptomyces sp. NPDC020858]|uniref:hypothetical protein n=1 Tax=Streptomyces sp. NPDC020858 TaxID=3365097 RepID=UPI0037877A4D
MTEATPQRGKPRRVSELRDVHDFLDEVRLRPGMWVRRSSVIHLDSMLTGFSVALEIHADAHDWEFGSGGGPFAVWLQKRLGMEYLSALGWAVEVERAAEQADRPAMELFFELLDEYRAERTGQGPANQAR